MQKDQNLEQGELLNTQNFAQEILSKESPLITHKEIEKTPFQVTGNEEKGYFIRMGSYRLTDYKQTIEEAEKLLETNKWEIIITIIAAIKHASGDQNIKMD